MIIFLFGEDTYRAKQKLNEIVEEYKKTRKSGLNLSFIDCQEENINIEDLKDKMRQTSMFEEKKLLIITNLFSNNDLKERFLKEAKEFLNSNDIVVIYEDKEIKKTDPLFKLLKKEAKSQEFKKLEGFPLKNWVKKQFDQSAAKIEPPALDLFLEFIGNDLWQMTNEIQKLASFKKNKTITTNDVKLLLKPQIETDIFRTIDAIGQKNKKQALHLLYKHLEHGDSPLYLLSMIGYQFRNLLMVKELVEKAKPYGQIVKLSGLHPFVVQKSFSQSKQFTLSELKKIYQKIFQVDIDAKTGKIDQEMALDLLVAGI